MSLNRLIENTSKPWLNIRVNNLTVDGTYVGPPPTSDSITVTGTVSIGNVLPVVTTAPIPQSFFQLTSRWYSAQLITFITQSDNAAAKKSISDVIFYVDGTYNLTNFAVSPYNVPYPTVGSFNFDLTYSSSAPLTITSTVTNLPNTSSYRLALVVSDVRSLI